MMYRTDAKIRFRRGTNERIHRLYIKATLSITLLALLINGFYFLTKM